MSGGKLSNQLQEDSLTHSRLSHVALGKHHLNFVFKADEIYLFMLPGVGLLGGSILPPFAFG